MAVTPEDLRRRAERAAAAIIAQHTLTTLDVSYDVLVAVVAVGWLEGYDASYDETRAALHDAPGQYARARLISQSDYNRLIVRVQS
jgi:hypothetical protein